MRVVIDSNIFIALTLVDEPLHSKANQILTFWQDEQYELIAPQLFRSEITAVLRKAVFQKRATAEQGQRMLLRLLSYPITYYEDDELLLTAFDIALRFNLPRAYDTQYVALAERFNIQLWTADERLFNSFQFRNAQIRWLGNWTSPDA